MTARRILRELKEQGADCVVLVANSAEGAVWVQAMAALEPDMRLPIISHWGITGGDFLSGLLGRIYVRWICRLCNLTLKTSMKCLRRIIVKSLKERSGFWVHAASVTTMEGACRVCAWL